MKKFVSMFVAVMMIFTSVAVVPSAYAAAPKAITLSKTSQTVYIGQKYTLKVKAVTPKKADTEVKWKTSDKRIATVSSKGVVTGKKKGTVTITAVSKSNSKIKAKCKVTIKKFKTSNIDYKYSNITGGGLELLDLHFENDNHQDPHIIKTYSELKALKKRIKKYYYISSYYDEDHPYYNSEMLEKRLIGDNIINKLNKYDKEFFKTKALYYNCIDYTTLTRGKDIEYSYNCVKVKKKINSKGKLVCTMYLKRKIKKFTNYKTPNNNINCVYESSASFVELNKKDIKGVQKYELKHSEEVQLRLTEFYLTED